MNYKGITTIRIPHCIIIHSDDRLPFHDRNPLLFAMLSDYHSVVYLSISLYHRLHNAENRFVDAKGDYMCDRIYCQRQ